MGYIKHDAVIALVDGKTKEAINAFKERMDEDYRQYLLGPTSGVNGYDCYVFAPDGSKEGWKTSTIAEDYRTEFLRIVKDAKAEWGDYPANDVVHIQFGGDDGNTIIHYTSDPEIHGVQK